MEEGDRRAWGRSFLDARLLAHVDLREGTGACCIWAAMPAERFLGISSVYVALGEDAGVSANGTHPSDG